MENTKPPVSVEQVVNTNPDNAAENTSPAIPSPANTEISEVPQSAVTAEGPSNSTRKKLLLVAGGVFVVLVLIIVIVGFSFGEFSNSLNSEDSQTGTGQLPENSNSEASLDQRLPGFELEPGDEGYGEPGMVENLPDNESAITETEEGIIIRPELEYVVGEKGYRDRELSDNMEIKLPKPLDVVETGTKIYAIFDPSMESNMLQFRVTNPTTKEAMYKSKILSSSTSSMGTTEFELNDTIQFSNPDKLEKDLDFEIFDITVDSEGRATYTLIYTQRVVREK